MPHYDTKIPAAWMIEQCGWKGKTLGRAGVHDRQALVLVNKGGATGKEILNLCNAVIADVEKKFGITLHPEVNIV
jgi:UDP-N-acetylmuramate dehydrogenase